MLTIRLPRDSSDDDVAAPEQQHIQQAATTP
jgi:hypothetical protein